MRLKAEQVDIAFEKITQYLLTEKEKNDKSKFLFALGYTKENWQKLLYDIKEIAINNDLILEKTSVYGNLYSVKGNLNQKKIITIWLHQLSKDMYRFITLYPNNDE